MKNRSFSRPPLFRPVVILGLMLCLLAGSAPADYRHHGTLPKTAGPFEIHVCAHSDHKGPNTQTQPRRIDAVYALGDATAPFRVAISGGGGTYHITKKTLAKVTTPFAGKIWAEAKKMGTKADGTPYFTRRAAKEVVWKHPVVKEGGDTELWASCYYAQIKEKKGPAGHILPDSTTMQATSTSIAGLPPIVTDFFEGGEPSIVNGFYEHDGMNQVVWVTPPALDTRFTSTVEDVGGVTTYVHRIDNFTDTDRTFHFSEIRTAAYSDGWDGTVEANSFEELSISVSGAHDVYNERSQLKLCDTDEAEAVSGGPVMHYSAEDDLAYDGTCEITSVTYDQSSSHNTIAFTVSGESVEGAFLIRENAGETEILDEIEDELYVGVTHGFTDDDPPAGENTYRVIVGVGVNGYLSEPGSVTN